MTIRQIAERCGVSVSTVSKALNGAQDVSSDTILRVRKIADEMGYMPNAAARALKTRRSFSMGILFAAAAEQGLTHEFFSRILNSFKDRAEDLGYDIAFISERLGRRSISVAEHVRYRNYDGVFVVLGDDDDVATAQALIRAGIPTVCVDYVLDGCGSVVSDNERGMAELVGYVIEKGHRKIAFIHGEDCNVTRQRVRSFLNTCAAHGIEVPEAYLVPSYYHNPEASRAATKQLLELADPPTCIIYPDDFSYVGGMGELDMQKLSVPQDISVAGYDGISICQAFRPRLTTLRQNAEAMGRCAAEELARAIEEGKHSDHRCILIPGVLLRGETVRAIET